jgi:hypothetical protein
MNSMSPHKGISTTTWFVARSYSWPVLGTSSVISCRCRVGRSSAGTRRRPHRWPRQAATGLCGSTFNWHRSSLPAAHFGKRDRRSRCGLPRRRRPFLEAAQAAERTLRLRKQVGHAARHGLAVIPSIQAWLNNWKYKQKITVDVLDKKFAYREARSAPRGTARSQAHLDRTLPKSGCGHLVRPRRYSGAAWARNGANDGAGRHRIRSSASEGVRACARSSAGCGCRR